MSTASTVNLWRTNAGVCHVPNIPEETFETGTRLRQANHELHRVFFNDRGFHNYLTHYLLTQVVIAATLAQMRRAYVQEKALQRPHFPINEKVVQQIKDGDFFKDCISQEKHYYNYLAFF